MIRTVEPDFADWLADMLLSYFGSVGQIFAASDSARDRAIGSWPAVTKMLSAAHGAVIASLSEATREMPVLASWDATLRYLRASMGHLSVEQLRVLFLDTRCKLIRNEMFWNGTVDRASYNLREIAIRCIDVGAAGILLAHNHPSGELSPSRQDILATRNIAEALRYLNIVVYDHIILSSRGALSMKAQGIFQ